MTKRVFIAVPEFTPHETIEKMRRKARNEGYVPLFAIDIKVNDSLEPHAFDEEKKTQYFYDLCEQLTSCDRIIANLTPVLGTEPDPDVTFQLGYMAAQNKPVHAYTNVSKTLCERVLEWNQTPFTTQEHPSASGAPTLTDYDRNGMRIENMGIKNPQIDSDNPGEDSYHHPMLEGPSIMSGIPVQTPALLGIEVPEEALYSNTNVFNRVCQDIKKYRQTEQNPTIYHKYKEDPNAAYIAGPGEFLPNSERYFVEAKEHMDSFHMRGVSPNDEPINFDSIKASAFPNGNNPLLRKAVYEARLANIAKAGLGIINLTPHRGVHPESSAVFEMGYMVGKDRALWKIPRVFGFSNSPHALNERIKNWKNSPLGPGYGTELALQRPSNHIYSKMVDGAILASKGHLDHRPSSLVAKANSLEGVNTYSDIATFKACVANIALKTQAEKAPNTSRFSIWTQPLSKEETQRINEDKRRSALNVS